MEDTMDEAQYGALPWPSMEWNSGFMASVDQNFKQLYITHTTPVLHTTDTKRCIASL